MGHLTIGMSHDVVYIFYLEDDQLYGFHTVDQEAPVWAVFFLRSWYLIMGSPLPSLCPSMLLWLI